MDVSSADRLPLKRGLELLGIRSRLPRVRCHDCDRGPHLSLAKAQPRQAEYWWPSPGFGQRPPKPTASLRSLSLLPQRASARKGVESQYTCAEYSRGPPFGQGSNCKTSFAAFLILGHARSTQRAIALHVLAPTAKSMCLIHTISRWSILKTCLCACMVNCNTSKRWQSRCSSEFDAGGGDS